MKKSLLSFFLFVLTLTGCSSTSKNINEEDYLSVTISYSNQTVESSDVVTSVENIYDSVVAINVNSNNQLIGSGSGVLIGKSEEFSFIITCHHVIENGDSFDIVLSDNTTKKGFLVGGDATSDIAVLAVKDTNLTIATWLGDTNTLKLGSTVICIGNPLGTLPGSVSTGVISYNNRKIDVDKYTTMDLIQTDVAINSGNSGGGLFNEYGLLIGIVNAKYSDTGIEGLGFAITGNTAKEIAEQLIQTSYYNSSLDSWKTGYVEGRWNLGFSLGYGTGPYRNYIGISAIATNGTSSDYGKLKINDLLVSIEINYASQDKEDITLDNISTRTMTTDTIYNFIYTSNLQIEDTLIFNIVRDNENISVEINLSQYCYYI